MVGSWRERLQRGRRRLWWVMDVCVHYLKCDDDSVGAHLCQNILKLNISDY